MAPTTQGRDALLHSAQSSFAGERTINFLLSTATFYRDSGHRRLYERVAAVAEFVARREFGHAHRHTLSAAWSRCEALMLNGRSFEAIDKVRALSMMFNDTAGADLRPQFAMLESEMLSRIGLFPEALAKLDGIRGPLPKGELHRATYSRAELLKELEQYSEALDELDQLEIKIDASDVFSLACKHLRADILNSSGLHAEALRVVTHVLNLSLERFGPVHVQTIRSRLLEADVLYRLRQFNEALGKAEPLRRDMGKLYGLNHPYVLACEHLVVALLHQTGRLNEARKRAIALISKRTDVLDADHPEVASSRSLLVDTLVNGGNLDEALDPLDPLLPARHPASGPRDRSTLMLRCMHAVTLSRQGFIQQAMEEAAELAPLMDEVLGINARESVEMRALFGLDCGKTYPVSPSGRPSPAPDLSQPHHLVPHMPSVVGQAARRRGPIPDDAGSQRGAHRSRARSAAPATGRTT